MTPRQRRVGQLGPWFRHRQRLAIAVAVVMAGAVWLSGLALPPDRAALSAIFGLPIALLAVTFGVRGGFIAGVAVMVLFVAWTVLEGVGGLGVSAWAGGTAMLLLGALLGEAVDGLALSELRVRRADAVRRRQAQAAERRREAVEINDMLVQSAATAKWALEAGDVKRALEILDKTVDAGQRLVTALINDDARLHSLDGDAAPD